MNYWADDDTFQGRPEIYFGDRWRTIDFWASETQDNGAAVACHQLGFASSDNNDTSNSGACSGCGRIYNVNCSGSEVMITDCTFSYSISNYEGVWVSCDITP